MTLHDHLERWRATTDARLRRHLNRAGGSPRLQEAMSYSLFNGGKRLRPLLTLATCTGLGGDESDALDAAAAVECIHAYSLIHDDLPAMDDDDLRRGKPTCHIAFDEATAVLAGDALQTLAFEILADGDRPAPPQRLAMVRLLAQAAGAGGMCAGQMRDMEAEGRLIGLDALQQIHAMKTGALIRASVQLGAIAAGAAAGVRQQLDLFAEAIGLAFQIRDDLLDVEASTEELGKRQGADQSRGKSTYPALLGMEGARAALAEQHRIAIAALKEVNLAGSSLHQLADYVIERRH